MSSTKSDVESKHNASEDDLSNEKDGERSNTDDATSPPRPVDWPATYKWTIVGLLSAMRLTVVLGTLICAPAAPSIVADLKAQNPSDQNLLVSIWELGEACGPLLVAPISELIGRAPVYNVCNICFVLFSIGGALSRNIESVLIFRFFQGVAVASIVLDPSVIGDLFPIEQRGRAMSIGSWAALIGPVAGPVIGGYISETIGWRWTFWLPAIMGGVTEIAFLAFFRETYWPRILRRHTGDKADAGAAFRKAIVRPVVMYFRSPVLFCVATYAAITFGYLYLILTSIEQAFQDAYGWSTGTASLAFTSNGVGIVIGVLFCQKLLDKMIKSKETGKVRLEGRIYAVVVAGIVVPAGLILYGWTIHFRIFWLVPMVGLALVGFGIALTNIPVFSYLVDTFGNFAASAIAASITLRCITGAIIPLAGPSLYGRLGQGWGNTVLGLTSLVILPIPVLLIKYGERLRGSASSFE